MNSLKRLLVAASVFLALNQNVFADENGASGNIQPELVVILDPGHGGSDGGGPNGNGFELNQIRVPEGKYVYDIARRIERLAILSRKNWKVLFTIRSPVSDIIQDNGADQILRDDQNEIYNIPEKMIKVHSGREGLSYRMVAAEEFLRKYPQANVVFISLHFDYAKPFVSGPRIIVPEGNKNKDFTLILKDSFVGKGVKAEVHKKEVPMIWESGPKKEVDLFILRAKTKPEIKDRVLVEFGNFMNTDDRLMFLRHDGREKYALIIFEALEIYFKGLQNLNYP